MKYYSEISKKLYESEEELKKDESEIQERTTVKETTKKELAKNIQKAEESYNLAVEHYNSALKEVQTLLKDTKEKVDEMLKEPLEEIKNTKADKFNALKDFNKQFGPYITTYTSENVDSDYKQIFNQKFPFEQMIDFIFNDCNFPFIW